MYHKPIIKEPVIKSMLDDDLYKFTMQQAFLELFPHAKGTYVFKNRGNHRFNMLFLDELSHHVNEFFPQLSLTENEALWLESTCPYLKPSYIQYLKNFRYNPNQVSMDLDETNNLVLEIDGTCVEAMMWEVKLMATISELYFKMLDTEWSMDGQRSYAYCKAKRLSDNGCNFVDFGTRRRRSYEVQDLILQEMSKFNGKGFLGTSNVHLSMKYGFSPKGTMAHEWVQAMQSLEGLKNSNYYAMNNWVRVYNGDLGIVLPDTLGTSMFLNNFSLRYAKLFDGVRWDSGDPYWFTDAIIGHYKKNNIDPRTKTIIYSNALDCDTAIDIQKYCYGKIKTSFGIGTYFTNDFGKDSPPLNMVIKLWGINDFPVVKISDDEGKEMGNEEAIKNAKWVIENTL